MDGVDALTSNGLLPKCRKLINTDSNTKKGWHSELSTQWSDRRALITLEPCIYTRINVYTSMYTYISACMYNKPIVLLKRFFQFQNQNKNSAKKNRIKNNNG